MGLQLEAYAKHCLLRSGAWLGAAGEAAACRNLTRRSPDCRPVSDAATHRARSSPRDRCSSGGCQHGVLTAIIFSLFLPITQRAGVFSRCRRALRHSPAASTSPWSLCTNLGCETQPEGWWDRETPRKNVSLQWQLPQVAFMAFGQHRSPNHNAKKKRESPQAAESEAASGLQSSPTSAVPPRAACCG